MPIEEIMLTVAVGGDDFARLVERQPDLLIERGEVIQKSGKVGDGPSWFVQFVRVRDAESYALMP